MRQSNYLSLSLSHSLSLSLTHTRFFKFYLFQFCYRAKAIKLGSQEEYNTERFKISQANAATYKKEISNLESKKNALQADLAKREHSIQVTSLVWKL